MPEARALRRFATAAALLLAAACSTLPVPDVAGDGVAAEQEIRAALTASAEGWNRGDLDAHLAPYADTATFMTATGPARGRARTRELLQRAYWADGRPSQTLGFSELEVRPLGPGHALVLGRFRLSGGDRPEATGRFSLVWGRSAEGWRIIHDHSS